MDITTRGLAVMNMILHGKETADIRQGDVLADPEFKAGDSQVQRFDYAVANPPFSSKAWASGFTPEEDVFGRFEKELLPPAKNGDFAFLLHIIASLKSTGSGAVILPHGVLFRGNEAEPHVHDVLNVFMCTGFTRDTGQYFMKASPVRPGDYLEVFAEIDLIGGLSACPGGDCSTQHSSDQAACHPLLVEIFAPKSGALKGWNTPMPNGYDQSHGR